MNIVRHPHSVVGVVVTSTNVMARNGRRIGGGLKNQRRGREKRASGGGGGGDGGNVNLSFGAANRRQKTPRRTRGWTQRHLEGRVDGKSNAVRFEDAETPDFSSN